MFRWILILVLACPAIVSAQMVRGSVTDATTNLPIKSANVTLFTTDGRRVGKVSTDEGGKFEMVLPKGKTVYVQAERIGYASSKSDPITATTSEVLELNVRLGTAAIAVQGIEVVARRQVDPRLREFMDRASIYKRAGVGHIWTRKELERRPFALASHVLNWVPPRRPFNCSGVSAFIDDMPVDAADIDLLVAPEELEGVELYGENDVPLELQSKAMSSSLHSATPPASGGGDAMPGENLATVNEGLVPPCQTMLLWRKPYAELNAIYASHPIKTWRVILGAVLVGGLIAAEQIWAHSR